VALTSRDLVRLEISALFDGIAGLQNNLAYPPIALEGASPVLWLHGDGTVPVMLARNSNQFDYYFIATIAINRQGHGAEVAENLLDSIWTAVIQAIRDNVTGTNYSTLNASPAKSRPYFATIDGLPYRLEEVAIMARSNITG